MISFNNGFFFFFKLIFDFSVHESVIPTILDQ